VNQPTCIGLPAATARISSKCCVPVVETQELTAALIQPRPLLRRRLLSVSSVNGQGMTARGQERNEVRDGRVSRVIGNGNRLHTRAILSRSTAGKTFMDEGNVVLGAMALSTYILLAAATQSAMIQGSLQAIEIETPCRTAF
jgi:hypothetical protein